MSREQLKWSVSPNGHWHHTDNGIREYLIADTRCRRLIFKFDGRRIGQVYVPSIKVAKGIAQRWDAMTEVEICEELWCV